MKRYLNLFYVIPVLLIICMPILVNQLLMLKPAVPVAGSIDSWFSFLGSYTGAIISGLITLYVLLKTLAQNHRENERNRHLQIDVFKYQIRKDWFDNLRKQLTEYMKSLDTMMLSEILILIRDEKYEDASDKSMKVLKYFEGMNIATGLMFSPPHVECEVDFLAFKADSQKKFCAIIQDLLFYSRILRKIAEDDISDQKAYVEKECKIEMENREILGDLFRGAIIDSIQNMGCENVIDKKEIIIENISNSIMAFDTEEVIKKVQKLLDEENELIETGLVKLV